MASSRAYTTVLKLHAEVLLLLSHNFIFVTLPVLLLLVGHGRRTRILHSVRICISSLGVSLLCLNIRFVFILKHDVLVLRGADIRLIHVVALLVNIALRSWSSSTRHDLLF